VAELLFEVGCEEIPAAWLEGVARQLGAAFEKRAEAVRLAPRELRALWTPRRLALTAIVAGRQPDSEERVWGPSAKVARDAAGGWTKAAIGFARKLGLEPGALQRAPKDPSAPDELHLVHLWKCQGEPASRVLSGVLAAALRDVAFPKKMSWDARLEGTPFPFGRPIRWLVALLDGEPIELVVRVQASADGELAVEAGSSTRGHRFLPRGHGAATPTLGGAGDYVGVLAKHGVLVDPAERAARIADGLKAAEKLGRIDDSHGLAAEWRDLVEKPAVVVGEVPAAFRGLPPEVLRTVLVHHQKYLPVVDAAGSVTHFAAVTDADPACAPTIVRGMQRVVVARLRDASFFFDEDRRRPLASRVEALAGVTLHKGLGSYADKAERLAALLRRAAAESLSDQDLAAAIEAARLAKADLTTLMVGEFPELQGVMGGLYLEAEGGDPDVARAVRWHYHPVSVEEQSLPAGQLSGRSERLFAAVSLADKLDTLAGYFNLGLAPTGSRDPFGLRRAGQGAIRVLLDFELSAAGAARPSLRRWIAAAEALHPDHARAVVRASSRDPGKLGEFLLERLRYVLGARGHAADEVEAALGAREPDALDDPREALFRVQALSRVRSEVPEDFAHLAVAFKRARNIAGEATGAVDPSAFEQDAERELHQALGELTGRDGSYEERLRALAGLRAPVDRFFDDVLVMTEDARLRDNRKALLGEALGLFYRIADISRLGG
jgi:glycyl-tRNA synthetase beta chain